MDAIRLLGADAEPGSWVSHGRTYAEQRYSPLDQVNDSNVADLKLAWYVDLDTNRGQEATPIVVDGVLYSTSAWSKVQAVDAKTGRLLWQYDPEVPGIWDVRACCGVQNRGAAVWKGRVYSATLDGRLLALDANTGELIAELDRQDTSRKFRGRRLTERFVAKGRDGKTDIWGIIHLPRGYSADRRYPVVENIYAGPHDHHVPKAFRTSYRHQHQIADRGIIVVQIDGMGTAWRSKAFHDVCHRNLRDAGFPDRIAWMKSAAEKHPAMDLNRVGIYGGSAGGQNAMAALLWHGTFYKAAVADCGCHDNRMDKLWWNEQWMGLPGDGHYVANSNAENAYRLQGRLMLVVGELDRNVDPASTTQVVNQLIRANKDFEFLLIPGAGHGACERPYGSRRRADFLAQSLGAD